MYHTYIAILLLFHTGPLFKAQRAFLMHFREAKLPIHIKMERATGEGLSELPTESKMLESTRALIKLQDEYRARAAHNIARAQERQKQQYDRNHNTNTTLKIGDKVLKENSKNKHRMGGKLDKRWTGPFIISEDLEKGRFRLKTLAGKTLKQTVHCARLKFYHDSNDQSEEPVAPADRSDSSDEPLAMKPSVTKPPATKPPATEPENPTAEIDLTGSASLFISNT